MLAAVALLCARSLLQLLFHDLSQGVRDEAIPQSIWMLVWVRVARFHGSLHPRLQECRRRLAAKRLVPLVDEVVQQQHQHVRPQAYLVLQMLVDVVASHAQVQAQHVLELFRRARQLGQI